MSVAEFGIHSRSSTSVQVSEGEFPSVGLMAALHRGKLPESGEYRVNFNQGPDWIQCVSLDRALGKGLIPELIAGCAVVIGKSRLPMEPGIHTNGIHIRKNPFT